VGSQQVHQHALVVGVQVLHQHEGNAGVGRHVIEERLERLESASGGANADDQKLGRRLWIYRLGSTGPRR
jgi:hypothetical protein